jgi:hypothetical protein
VKPVSTPTPQPQGRPAPAKPNSDGGIKIPEFLRRK